VLYTIDRTLYSTKVHALSLSFPFLIFCIAFRSNVMFVRKQTMRVFAKSMPW
jgi:hypothetical protein